MGSITTFSTLPLSVEHFDIGENFDTGDYKFVAPVDGFYQFNVGTYYFPLQKSGTWYSTKLTVNENDQSFRASSGPSTEGDLLSLDLSALVHLDAADYVTVRVWQTAGTLSVVEVVDSPGTWFTGHLVWRDIV